MRGGKAELEQFATVTDALAPSTRLVHPASRAFTRGHPRQWMDSKDRRPPRPLTQPRRSRFGGDSAGKAARPSWNKGRAIFSVGGLGWRAGSACRGGWAPGRTAGEERTTRTRTHTPEWDERRVKAFSKATCARSLSFRPERRHTKRAGMGTYSERWLTKGHGAPG